MTERPLRQYKAAEAVQDRETEIDRETEKDRETVKTEESIPERGDL